MIDQGRDELEILECDHPVILLNSEVYFKNTPDLKKAIRYLIDKGYTDLHLNCSELEFIDSSGISVLINAWKAANAVGGYVRLFYPPDQFLRILGLTGLEEYFEIVSSNIKSPVSIQDTGKIWDHYKFVVPARPDVVSSIRSRIAHFAGMMGFQKEQIDDIELAVGEAASNSVRHGSPNGENCRIEVLCERHEDRIVIEIKDEGCGFDLSSRPDIIPDKLQEGGRGIFFMRILMDKADFRFGRGTTVRLVKYL